MGLAMKLFAILILMPMAAWGASCQPWSVRIVYPQATRPCRVQQKPKGVHKIVAKPKAEPPAPRWAMPQGKSSFVSGSATKPETNEFQQWKEEYEKSEPVLRKKRAKELAEAKATINNLLDDRHAPRPKVEVDKPPEIEEVE